MKTVYKILLLSCLFIVATMGANAQFAKKRFSTDIHIGLNFAEMDIKQLNEDNKMVGANMYKQPKLGMSIGMNFNYKILYNIQLQTGFFVTKKGLKQDEETNPNSGTGTQYTVVKKSHTAANYMQIPLCIGFETFFTKTVGFNINGGVYGAYGYSGTYKTESYNVTVNPGEDPVVSEVSIVEGNTYDLLQWKHWDYGLIGSVGLIYDIYMINLNYELGIANLSAIGGQELRNRNMSVSLGVRF
ncbi:MAG: PorT family protein [Prevotella sp.]|jgi:hypothetical protein|nr:PorT family protein [Prevotella sp.]